MSPRAARIAVIWTLVLLTLWLGATRMAASSTEGCVDTNLRYHELENLFVLSTSTFPGGSSANPTLTLAALTCRLADRLAPAADRPTSAVR